MFWITRQPINQAIDNPASPPETRAGDRRGLPSPKTKRLRLCVCVGGGAVNQMGAVSALSRSLTFTSSKNGGRRRPAAPSEFAVGVGLGAGPRPSTCVLQVHCSHTLLLSGTSCRFSRDRCGTADSSPSPRSLEPALRGRDAHTGRAGSPWPISHSASLPSFLSSSLWLEAQSLPRSS